MHFKLPFEIRIKSKGFLLPFNTVANARLFDVLQKWTLKPFSYDYLFLILDWR